LPFVEFRAAFLGGVLAETAATNGVTSLMSRMLVKGTRTRTAEEIAGEIENVGGSLDTYAGNNSVGISAEVLREDFETGLHLIADVLRNPAWPAGPLERERDTALASIRHQRDQLLQHAFKLARRGLFGATAYGLDQLGTEQVVSKLTAAELARIHADLVTPANGVLAIFGDVKAPEVRRAIDQALGDWHSAAPGFHPPEAVSPVTASRLVEPRDKEQAVVVLAYPGSTLKAEDREALELLQEVCSDMGSRLFLRIRDELGLAYYVGASNFPGLVPGYFAFYCGTAPEKADEVERELRAQVEALRREGVTAGELARAKAKVIGQKKIARQDLGQLAMTMALDELYGLGFANIDREDARYQAVTLEGIHAAAAKYLRSEKAVAVILQGKPVVT
jgi:zinc protease